MALAFVIIFQSNSACILPRMVTQVKNACSKIDKRTLAIKTAGQDQRHTHAHDKKKRKEGKKNKNTLTMLGEDSWIKGTFAGYSHSNVIIDIKKLTFFQTTCKGKQLAVVASENLWFAFLRGVLEKWIIHYHLRGKFLKGWWDISIWCRLYFAESFASFIYIILYKSSLNICAYSLYCH